MRAIRSRDTGPELAIRKGLHALGFRYSLHSRLPGRPDLVLRKYRAIVWVHGCYWHGHDCNQTRLPQSNQSYWHPKIAGNRERDQRNRTAVEAVGWRSLTVWDCCLRGKDAPGIEKVVLATAEWLRSYAASAEMTRDSLTA